MTCFFMRPKPSSSLAVLAEDDFPGFEMLRMGHRSLQDVDETFWDGEALAAVNESQQVPNANHMVNATELDPNKVYLNVEDIRRIEKFYRSIVPVASAMYEGTWLVPDETEAHDKLMLLNQAFGADHEDAEGTYSTNKGRMRAFMYRQSLTQSTVSQIFGNAYASDPSEVDYSEDKVNDTNDDEEDDEDKEAAGATSDDETAKPGSKVKPGFKTALRTKMILLDGQYREQEIDLFFSTNPRDNP